MKTILLFLAFAMGLFAQSYPFTFSPTTVNATADPCAGGIQVISQLTVSLPATTVSYHAYQIIAGYNPAYSVVPVTPGSTNPGSLEPGQSAVFDIEVNANNLAPATYTVPIEINDITTPQNTQQGGFTINLTVACGLNDFPQSNTLVVPHLTSGYGWRTIFQLTNPTSTISLVDINFYNEAGYSSLFKLRDYTNPEFKVTVPIQAFSTTNVILEDPTNPNTLTGSAEITPEVGSPTVGLTVIYETLNSVPYDSAYTPSTLNKTLNFWYDNTNGRQTGLALRNSLNYSSNISLTYYGIDGTILETKSLTLAAKGHTSFLLNDVALLNQTGLLVVSTTYNVLSGLEMFFNVNFQFIPVSLF